MPQVSNATMTAPPDSVTNPVAVTPTIPPTRAPIIGQGPVTENPLINTAIGMGVVGASQAGFAAMTGSAEVLGTSTFLNLIGQLFKKVKWFPEHEGLIVLFLAISFVVAYFLLPGTAHEAGKAFLHMANSTMQAILNYKGDKAAGLNVMPPVPEHQEFGKGD